MEEQKNPTNSNILPYFISFPLSLSIGRLVQLFWLGCLNAMRPSQSQFSLWIVLPIGFGVVCLLGLAIAVGIISETRYSPYGSWLTPEIDKWADAVKSF